MLRQVIPWLKSVIFIGGVLALASAAEAPETGIPSAVTAAFGPFLGNLTEYGLVFLLTLGVMLISGVISNLVSLSIFIPLSATMAQAFGTAHPVALGLTLGMAGCLAHLLPSGTITNAIVAGSGWLRVPAMLSKGLPILFVHALVLTAVTYPLAKALLPGAL